MADVFDRTDPVAVRRAVRAGLWRAPTRGLAPGHVQCNVVILPAAWAEEFDAWCAANRHACPVLARSEPGDPTLPALGEDLDITTDLPRYAVFIDGQRACVDSVRDRWRDDLVTFAFGCSFTLEDLLRREGIDLRYERRGFGGAIYATRLETTPVGRFGGPLVVSMRPLRPPSAITAIALSAAYPALHGAPVHIGFPEQIGVSVADPMDAVGTVSVADDELPVFWACGVTPQLALERAGPALAITHWSGHMLVTDLTIADLGQTSAPQAAAPRHTHPRPLVGRRAGSSSTSGEANTENC